MPSRLAPAAPLLFLFAALLLPGFARPRVEQIRTRGDRFEIVTPKGARTIFFRGVNLGAGTPGHFPGEFAITKEAYRRWIRFVRGLHANAIRVYALHPPAFYTALREENEAHPGDPLWLFQEVWTELPPGHDFRDVGYTRAFEEEIRLAIDAVHGNAMVRERPGHASGRYEADVSRWLAGWILGREWEPYAVRETQARHPRSTSFAGKYFAVANGTAMETWLARVCDVAASYEAARYGLAHAVSFVNWPTLDPMRHPTESEREGREAEHDEDAYSVDPGRIRAIREPGAESGFLGYFANYHVYPYYPDFINLDPGYSAYRDRHGLCNYAGYLADLKSHTRGLPLLIGEYGVPSSRGIAHLQPQGIHHGGSSEEEQGAWDARLFEDIVEAGCAGSLLFALFDEWFKVNWLVERTERPRDRDPLWLNRLDPEENYGLIAFDPPPAIRIDGEAGDWIGIEPYAAAVEPPAEGGPLRSVYVTSDPTRLYVRIDIAPGAGLRAVGLSLDVLDPARGDRRLPAPIDAVWSRGAEFVLVLEPPEARAELFVDRSMSYSAYARVRTRSGAFTKHRAPFRPVANDDGLYAPLLVETNRERVARGGERFPARYLDWGRLSVRRVLPGARRGGPDRSADDARAECAFAPDGRTAEVAIPWGLLNVGDPSSRSVIDDRSGTPEVEVSPTRGIGILAWGTTASGLAADSTGPARDGARRARTGEVFFLGPPGTSLGVHGTAVSVVTPGDASYLWNGWNQPITEERAKRSVARVKEAFEGMDAREERQSFGKGSGDR